MDKEVKLAIVKMGLPAIVAVYAIYVLAHVLSGEGIPNGLIFGSVIGGIITLVNIVASGKVIGKLKSKVLAELTGTEEVE